MKEEKRISFRITSIKDKEYSLNFDNAPTGRLVNFSRNGLGIESFKPLEKNKMYDFTISAKGLKTSIPCEAYIVWDSSSGQEGPFCYGARIAQMKSSDKIDLIEILYQDWKRSISEQLR